MNQVLLLALAALVSRPAHDALPAAALTASRLVDARLAMAAADPLAGDRSSAVRLYAWAEGALYRLEAAPGHLSAIELQPGETLVSVAAGDTARWVIGDTASGSGPSRRTLILVKPVAAGLSTNIVIATDRRLYRLEVSSVAGAAAAAIAWTYPAEDLLAIRRAGAAAMALPVSADVAVERLNFNYRIEGDRPSWRPVRAFDDGRQVFIEFPAGMGADEAPPLFVTGENGKPELVNYRLRGRYYVVDRLFGAAELRLGGKRQQVVRMIRLGGRGSPEARQ